MCVCVVYTETSPQVPILVASYQFVKQKMMLILYLSLLCGINCLPSALELPPPSLVTPPPLQVQPRHVHLALGEEPDTLAVSWSTVNSTAESVVLVYSRGRELAFQGEAVLFVDGGKKKASQWIHKVIVSGLDGDSSYRYRVGSSLGWSDVFIMQTLPSGLLFL